MPNRHVLLAAVVGMGLSGGAAIAALDVPKDSSLFPYKYEGDALPTDASYSALGFTAGGPSVGNISNIVSLGSESGTNFIKVDTDTNAQSGESFYYEISGAGGTNPVWNPRADGNFTVEFRVRARPTNAGTFSNTVQTGDINSSGFQQFYHDHFIGDNGVNTSFTSDTANFHTYRIASHSPDGSSASQVYVVYRDNELLGTFNQSTAGVDVYNQLRFGDIISGGSEVNFDLDYIRWDLTGAYQPVPEPAAVSLLGLGALAIRRRK